MSHKPVLLKESIDNLRIQKDDIVIDGTLGGAGHAKAICDLLGKSGIFIGIDIDKDAIKRAKKILENTMPKKMFFTENFRNIDTVIESSGVSVVNKIFFDLGWSMYQIEESGRGFTFRRNEPLLMTFKKNPDEEKNITARKIINEWSEESIANVIYGYGEEKYARKIAKNIVAARKEKAIETSGELAEIVEKSFPAKLRHAGRIHPATKTFQAIRIAVNDELGALSEALEKSIEKLSTNGRLAVISFHSIEDRIVKKFFAEKEKNNIGIRVTKKPITASDMEIKENPKSRSAKLRVFEKL